MWLSRTLPHPILPEPADGSGNSSPQVKDNIRLKSIPVPTKFGGGRPYLLLGLLLGLLLDLLLRGGLGTLTAWGTGIGALYEFLFCGWKWTWVPVKDFNIEDYIKLHVLDQPTEDCLHDVLLPLLLVLCPVPCALWRWCRWRMRFEGAGA